MTSIPHFIDTCRDSDEFNDLKLIINLPIIAIIINIGHIIFIQIRLSRLLVTTVVDICV